MYKWYHLKKKDIINKKEIQFFLTIPDVISLPENRKQVLDALIMDIKEKHPAGDIKPYCRKKLEQIKAMDDKKIPFVGILIWGLEKHS